MSALKAKLHQLDICSSGFSSKGWLLQCNSSLVCASDRIDGLCSAIVNTKSLFHSDLSCETSRELGDLALTVAALERSIYDYARRIRVANKRTNLPSPDRLSVDHQKSNELSLENDKFLWKHPGAVISLLDLLTDCMEQLGFVLQDLQGKYSFSRFCQNHRVKLAALVASLVGLDAYLHRVQILKVFQRMGMSSFSMGKLVLKLASSFALIFFIYYWSLSTSHKKMRALHLRLSTLMRFWQLCMSEIQSSSAPTPNPSTPTSEPGSAKSKPRLTRKASVVPISRWMLDLVGVSTIWYEYMYDVDKDLWFLWYTYSILYSSVKAWYNLCGNSIKWYGFPLALLASVYYTLRPRLAAATASELLSSIYSLRRTSLGSLSKSKKVKLSHIKNAWIFYDNLISEWKRKWSWIWSSVFRDSSLFLSPSMSAIWPMRWLAFYSVSVLGLGSVGIRVKPPAGVPDAENFSQMVSVIGSKALQKARTERAGSDQNPVLLYIHGGGWVANFLNSDLTFLHLWADNCDLPVVAFDYSLNRRKNFSGEDALKHASIAYEWLTSGGLGFVPSKVILAGDSVGARIAIGLCSQLVMSDSQKSPGGLILAYPPLKLSMVSSPSRAVFMMDPIVPMSILNQNSDWSKIEEKDSGSPRESRTESFDSILDAPDHVLTNFPPTSIMVGSIDPFVDDSVDFAHRLSSLGVLCRFKMYKNLPHGFLGFQTMLPKAREGVELAVEWIKECL